MIQTYRHINRQTERQRNRETTKLVSIQAIAQTERHIDRYTETHRLKNIHAYRHRQTDRGKMLDYIHRARQTDRKTDRQRDRQTERDRQTDRRTGNHTDR